MQVPHERRCMTELGQTVRGQCVLVFELTKVARDRSFMSISRSGPKHVKSYLVITRSQSQKNTENHPNDSES